MKSRRNFWMPLGALALVAILAVGVAARQTDVPTQTSLSSDQQFSASIFGSAPTSTAGVTKWRNNTGADGIRTMNWQSFDKKAKNFDGPTGVVIILYDSSGGTGGPDDNWTAARQGGGKSPMHLYAVMTSYGGSGSRGLGHGKIVQANATSIWGRPDLQTNWPRDHGNISNSAASTAACSKGGCAPVNANTLLPNNGGAIST